MAVEKLVPDAGSVIELGGQDAKIIIFKVNEETGEKQVQTSIRNVRAGAYWRLPWRRPFEELGEAAGPELVADEERHALQENSAIGETTGEIAPLTS